MRYGPLDLEMGGVSLYPLGRPTWLEQLIEPNVFIVGHLHEDDYLYNRNTEESIFDIDIRSSRQKDIYDFPSIYHCVAFFTIFRNKKWQCGPKA